MAKFAWAFINCSGSSDGSSAGPAQSLQFVTSSTATSTTGSMMLTFHTASAGGHQPATLILSGNMVVTGTLSASVLNYENITVIDATGSTYFGNTDDDMHERTGSLIVSNAGGAYILSASVTDFRTHVKAFSGLYRRATGAIITGSSTDYIIGCSGSVNQKLFLPTASAVGAGGLLVVKDEFLVRGAGSYVQISSALGTGNKIDGKANYALTGTMPAINLYTDGTNWFVY